MTGAVFYDSKYGATAAYARWIGAATGLPVFTTADPAADPDRFDVIVLGSPVYFYKVLLRSWIKLHLRCLTSRPVVFFTVSGAPAGAKLDGWISDSLPPAFVRHARRFALPGRIDRASLSWFDRLMLDWDARRNPDPAEAQQERDGFDGVDRAAIAPVVAAVRGMLARQAA